MRARGGQVADIAVIVVAADDGVMPQTREAIDHAKAAEVPMLVAVNKIDKEGAQPDRVRTEMTNLGLQPEEWGGETMFVDVSAKTKQNLDELMESILLVAEVEELKANPDTNASGQVIESKLDPGRGAVVTVLVQRGTLKVGDALVAGAHWGRVRAMHDFHGTRVKEAGPSMPVEVLGFDSVPEAGEFVRVVENDRTARSLAGERATRLKLEQQARRSGKKTSLETIFDQQRGALVSELNLVLKADVSGSLEAFEDEIAKLPQSEVQVQVVRSGVGGITESDVNLASASEAVVLGFNVRPVGEAAQVADREGVEIRTYSVIYRAIDELRDAMQGMLAPEEVEETVGTAEVRAIFRASKVGTIAGSMVTDGKITRGSKIRLVRDGTIVHYGRDRLAAARRRRRARGGRRLRVRHRARQLRGHQGRRHHRGIRDAPGRAQALLDVAGRARVRGAHARPSALPRVRLAEGQASRAQPRQGPSAPADGRVRGRGRRAGHVAALDARRGVRGGLAGALRRGGRPGAADARRELPPGRAGRAPDRLLG